MTLQNMALVFGHILMRGSIFDDLLANMTAVYTIMELLCKRVSYINLLDGGMLESKLSLGTSLTRASQSTCTLRKHQCEMTILY